MGEQNDENKRKNVPAGGYEDIDDFSVMEKRYSPEPAPVQTAEKAEPEPAGAPARRPEKAAGGGGKKVLKKTAAAAAAVIVLVAAAFAVYAFTLPEDKIAYGVKAGGVSIGGLTVDEAAVKLENSKVSDKHEIVIVSGGTRYTLLPADIDAQINIRETAQRAFDASKRGNRFFNAFASLRLLASGAEITPDITYNEEKLAAKINEIGLNAVGSALTEHTVRFADDGKAYIVPGKSGYNNDPTEAIEKVKAALESSAAGDIEIEFTSIHPAELTIEALDAAIYRNPVNAAYSLENGSVMVTPDQKGRYIDKLACADLLKTVAEGGPEVEVPYSVSEPEVTAAVLQAKLFNGKLASYTTRYNARQANRSANIANAAGRLNGKIIMPGETFSFNETVGKRTIANGFKTAPEYQNGQTVDGIGGGTCQVSTTLYSAALYADLKIVKRSNHSMSVSYVPLGQDATVTDGGLDLKIMNDTGYPVKITTSAGGGAVTVTFTGTTPEPAKTVKIVHTNAQASAGRAVKTERIVYDASGNVIKQESMGTSRYKPHESSSSSGNSSEQSTNKPVRGEAAAPAFAPENTGGGQQPEAKPSAEAQPKPEVSHAPAKPEVTPEKNEPAASGGATPEKTE
ncbi:MAG: VanW family protein [Clostridia bacterium]|nr:VanW family protein [Clostridia bacterium]